MTQTALVLLIGSTSTLSSSRTNLNVANGSDEWVLSVTLALLQLS